jgi:hypothetical protein
MEIPNSPLSQIAANRANQSVGRYGPDLEKFFYGMMNKGGEQDLNDILSAMDKTQKSGAEQTRASVMNSGIPMNSTAMARALSGQLGQQADQYAMNRALLKRDEMGNVYNRQMQGATGLGSMPSYYSAPSSIELAMLGLQNQANMANMQSQLGTQEMQGNALSSLLSNDQNRWYMTDSPFSMYVEPFLNPVMTLFGGLLPYIIGGGGGTD